MPGSIVTDNSGARPYYIYGGNLLDREKYTSVVNTTYGPKRYFSSIDTEVYFGERLIEEMVAFDFIIEEKKMPIFGYNNFTPKRMMIGQKVIQGSFAINFTRTFDLYYLFQEEIKDSIYANKYEATQFYCSDDNRAIFDKSFDITLSYGEGYAEGSYNSCTQTLVGVQITSYRQAFDTSGEPILDMYTFVAKDLLVESSTAPAVKEEKIETPTSGTNTDKGTGPEAYYMANRHNSEEQRASNYYAEHKNDTPIPICIDVAPAFAPTTSAYKITSPVELANEELLSSFSVESFKVVITDKKLKDFVSKLKKPVTVANVTYSLKKDSSNGTVMPYYTVTLPNGVGNAINKYFENTDAKYIDCEIRFDYNVKRDGISVGDPITKQTRIYSEKGIR